MCGARKYLDNRIFLEYGDAQDLEKANSAVKKMEEIKTAHHLEMLKATGVPLLCEQFQLVVGFGA